MILFWDTSALLKLYIDEQGSDVVFDGRADAEVVAVSRIACAEFHADLTRRIGESPEDVALVELAKKGLRTDWSQFLVAEITQFLVVRAGDCADLFALRGFDSAQLASASEIAIHSQSPVCFASFDLRLNKAAKALGMTCI
jgi:uncharacterized protein